ncbi:MAG: methylated-DNA--[protein]-cysteine S-methyltransferase [Solirubrobacteraceae bacterium]|nr:methylated-DNA--[protein]-cysteine S-methyltransferase [Patulibacter sp.]
MSTIHTTLSFGNFGDIQLMAGDHGLQALSMAGQAHFIHAPADSRSDPRAELFVRAQAQLEAYFAGDLRDFDLPVDLRGSDSQLAVWRELTTIPYGRSTTYGAVAAAVGHPGMAQAVGQHVGHNPVGIIVPCHRVIGADGSLTGYAGGLERKRHLLTLEGVLQPTLL